MADRRGESREGEQDILFAHSMLTVIANYVKILLSRQQSEGTMQNLSSILDHTGVNVYVTDFYTNEILYANQVIAERYNGAENLIGKQCWQTLFDDQTGPCDFCPKHRLVDEYQIPVEDVYIWNNYQARTDTWYRMISSAFYWVDGRLAHVVSSVDITESKKNEEKIRRYAEYDALTGLGNRHKLLLDCDDGIERLSAEGKEGFLIFCDLNDFKRVNDTLGHQTGDELLSLIGQSFNDDPRTSGLTYRYGGDEFVILCFNHTRDEVESLKNHIIDRFSNPWRLQGQTINCGTSAGITSYPADAKTTSDLLHSADQAMYIAKSRKDTL